jgi:hypothetical protein
MESHVRLCLTEIFLSRGNVKRKVVEKDKQKILYAVCFAQKVVLFTGYF